MTFSAIVVAAGGGTRFGGPKHLTVLGGRPLWEHGRSMLVDAGADEVVVVGDVPGGVPGGQRRRDSVQAGLDALATDPEFVLIHDAARPLASASLAKLVLQRLEQGGVDAVVPVVAVTDAIKAVDDGGGLRAVDRSQLRAVQTPQGFRTASLLSAHDEVDGDAADDAELIELWGGSMATVPGETGNLKITFPSDIVIASAILEQL